MIKFIESKTAPSPKEYTYWVDLTENSHCGVIKYFNGSEWESISGDSEQNAEIQQIKNQLNNLNSKVNEVSGKQLSTNDYTTSEKQKLAGLNNTVVINNLTTTSTISALSAAQGKVLKDALDILAARVAALETSAA